MPTTTRAAVLFAPNEPMQIREVTLADPGAGDVMVKFLATGLCGSDLHIIEGSIASAFPLILGHEGIGEVVAVGEEVGEFSPGDRVIPFLVPDCGTCVFCRSGKTNLCLKFQERLMTRPSPFTLDGQPVAAYMNIASFAEMTVIPADMLTKVSVAAQPEQACCIACGVTTGLGAALITAKVTPGSSVAVFGGGGVGLSVVQGAKIAGASKIIVVDTNDSKRDVVAKLGGTDFVNPGEVNDVVEHIRKLTGLGVDFAFECVGIPALAQQALESTNPAWGTAVCVGVQPAGSQLSTSPNNLMMGRRWTGSFMGGAKRADVARFVDLFVDGEVKLDDMVSHQLKLEQINEGFEMMRKGEIVRAVVVYN